MKNLETIFGIIKKYCAETGMADEQCFAALEKTVAGNSIFFPLFYYLRVLQSLGLIELSNPGKQMILTEKGKMAKSLNVSNLWALTVVFLHTLRRVVIVTFVFTLFWPVFLTIQQEHNMESNNEGRLSRR